MKKKLISIALALVMLLTMLPFAAFAESTLPLVIVSGYSSSQIYEFDDEGNITKKLWGIEGGEGTTSTLLNFLPELAAPTFEYLINNDPALLEKKLGEGAMAVMDHFMLNPDGTSKYNSDTWPKTAAESNMKYIYDHVEEDPKLEGAMHEARYLPYLTERLGAENVYQCCVDWRKTAIECAFTLGQYVKDVKAYSGASQVNIFCESHGGQVTGTYLSLCSIVDKGGENAAKLATLLGVEEAELKNYFDLSDIHNVMMNSPAVGGVQLAYDLIKGGDGLHFDVPLIMQFVEYALNPLYSVSGGNEYTWEANLEAILQCVEVERIDALVDGILQNHCLPLVLSLGSMWDFMALGKYDEIKASYLDTEEKALAYAPMIAKSDYTHYVVMENLNENLTYAREHGVNVNIVVGTDLTTVSGGQVNGDGLIDAHTASGAKTLDVGCRFNDGYKTNYSDSAVTCTDPTHNHVSPSMNLDAAYGYLPENTWYVEGQFHAQYAVDKYVWDLTNAILFDETIEDIYSSEKYPQFNVTHNAKLGVHAAFDNSVYGTVTKADTALVVTNLSEKSDIEITGITVSGMDISFDTAAGTTVKLGESVTLPYTGEIPDVDGKNVKVTVLFIADDTVCPLGSRTFNYVIRGGQPVEFDEANPIINEKSDSDSWIKDLVSKLDSFSWPAKLKALILALVKAVRVMFTAFGGLNIGDSAA